MLGEIIIIWFSSGGSGWKLFKSLPDSVTLSESGNRRKENE
jgi:hypothetical protein